MNTILIQASKDKAKVQDNNGKFMNEVSQGIPVNVGDKISLEGIAINSTGVGSNIIEIPSSIKGFNYKTNTIALRFNPYIHNNLDFACPLPTNKLTTTYTTTTDVNFGYPNRANPPAKNNLGLGTPDADKTKSKLQDGETNLGERYYLLGCNTDELSNVFEEGYLPYQGLWKAQEMDIKLEVPIGYDSPQNIAQKMTLQLHKCIPSQFNQQGILGNKSSATRYSNSVPSLPFTATDTFPAYRQNTFTGEVLSGGAVVQTRGANSVGINQATAPTPVFDNNAWYACLATQNPKLWEYGSALLANGIKNMTFVNQDVGGVAHPAGKTNCVYFLGQVPIVAGFCVIPDNYIFTTNLDYNVLNLKGLASFLHTQKVWNGIGKTTDEMKIAENNIYWESPFSIGRYNDAAATRTAGGSTGKLTPPCWVSPAVAYPTACNCDIVRSYTYFQQDKWDAIDKEQSDLQQNGWIVNYDMSPKIDLGNGSGLLNAYETAVGLNCMLVPVRTSPTFITPAGATEWSIGIVMKRNNLGANPMSERNYCLFDFAFYNPLNPCIEMLNPNYYKQHTTTTTPAVPEVPFQAEIPFQAAIPEVPFQAGVPEVPFQAAIPATNNLLNSSADGNNALVSDFDVANNVPPLVLNSGIRLFTDDGGTAADYSTSHSRHITYDAGLGGKIYLKFASFNFEASSFSHYDRLGITASNSVSGLSLSSSNLSSTTAPVLGQYLYQTSSSSPTTFWGNSYVSGNGGYGTGGGWIIPSSSGTDSKGNNNAGWADNSTWYEINTRYVRFWFFSDGSSTDTGWEIYVAPAVFVPEVPEVPFQAAIPEVPFQAAVPEIPFQAEVPFQAAIPETTTLGAPDPTDPNNYTNIIQVGAPNAEIQFDGDKGRFAFSNLHWATRVGSGTGTDAVSAAPDVVIKTNVNSTNLPFQSVGTNISQFAPFTNMAQSGIAIGRIGLVRKNINAPELITWFGNQNDYEGEQEPALFKDCLLGRMGFLFTDLVSKYGYTNSTFKEGTYNTDIQTINCNDYPNPLTTNPELSTSLALGLSVNTSTLPMFDLGLQNNEFGINLTSETALIYARNLPNKLVFPYWLVYSDIIEGIEYHSVEDGEKDNIIAVCNRAYISGDFAFSFATDYVFTATRDFVITGITTQILNPDLTPADIDDKTSVIYKIEKPIPMFNQPIENLPTKREAVAVGKQTTSKS